MRNTAEKEKPSGPSTKAVQEMFDNIARRYDLLNHLLSFGVDRIWRRKLTGILKEQDPGTVLDAATGTADLAIAAAQNTSARITGIDISGEMLSQGLSKVVSARLQDRIELVMASAMQMPFPDESFDCVMVAFGVRNFESLDKGLREFRRVLRANGKLMILEFSTPQRFPFRQLYRMYLGYTVPLAGRWISRDPSAYSYLRDSVRAFPFGNDFLKILKNNGFRNTEEKKLHFGIASIYTAEN